MSTLNVPSQLNLIEYLTYFRAKLGPKLVVVNLEMDPEDLRKRVLVRHQGDEDAADMMAVMIYFIQFTVLTAIFKKYVIST